MTVASLVVVNLILVYLNFSRLLYATYRNYLVTTGAVIVILRMVSSGLSTLFLFFGCNVTLGIRHWLVTASLYTSPTNSEAKIYYRLYM